MLRLKQLYIKEYKNIKEQSFDFSDNTGYIAIIGLNGSGKSNLLEAISLIFDDLYGVPHSSQAFVNGFRISYEIDGQSHTYSTLDEQNNIIPLAKGEKVCPSSVIACYSGEDLRLWNMAYMPYYMEFFRAALRGKDYIPQTMYINRYCWKIALLSLLFSLNRNVQQFVQDTLHIDVNNVSVRFEYNTITNAQKHDAYNWLERVKQAYGTSDIPLTDLRDFGLNNLQHQELTEDRLIFYYLFFLFIPSKSDKQPVDKLITNITIKLGSFEFDSLSEGEKKMILIACITQILGEENSLILLDEPDAHTHIAMKKDILKLISEFEGQTIMTTHSPMFLNKRWQGYNDDNIFYLCEGKIENTEPLKFLADITNNEIDYFEGSFILSSKNILVTEGPYDILYIKHAIEKLADENPNYIKIKEQVAFMHAGGADNAKELYQQTLYPFINKIQKLVFIFDYDKEGFGAAERLNEFMTSNNDTKPVLLFYQDDYTTRKTRKPKDKDAESYIAEDMFDSNSYINVTNKIHVSSHKELRNMTWNDVITSNKRPKGTADAIKYYIQDNYASFQKEWLQNFKPVLDKLLDVFDLN